MFKIARTKKLTVQVPV